MYRFVLLSLLMIVMLFSSTSIVPAFSQSQSQVQGPRLVFLINQDNFLPGSILVVYGKTFANDTLVVRIFDPAGKAVRIESVKADSTGTFTEQIFTWPQPSKN